MITLPHFLQLSTAGLNVQMIVSVKTFESSHVKFTKDLKLQFYIQADIKKQ